METTKIKKNLLDFNLRKTTFFFKLILQELIRQYFKLSHLIRF